MIQLTPLMKVLVCVEPIDFRGGIDGLARLCRQSMGEDPMSGTTFVFRNRRGTGLRLLSYDGQGFWLCYKRLSVGRLSWWPTQKQGKVCRLRSFELAVLLAGGDPTGARAAADWRPIAPH